MSIVPAPEALQRLRDGNTRFVANDLQHDDIADAQNRSKLAACQDPFSIILGCSDSRVPVELVFDPPWSRDMMSEEAQLELGLF